MFMSVRIHAAYSKQKMKQNKSKLNPWRLCVWSRRERCSDYWAESEHKYSTLYTANNENQQCLEKLKQEVLLDQCCLHLVKWSIGVRGKQLKTQNQMMTEDLESEL